MQPVKVAISIKEARQYFEPVRRILRGELGTGTISNYQLLQPIVEYAAGTNVRTGSLPSFAQFQYGDERRDKVLQTYVSDEAERGLKRRYGAFAVGILRKTAHDVATQPEAKKEFIGFVRRRDANEVRG